MIRLKNNLAIIGILFISLNLYSQLNGNAFLSGQTNHLGIKIKFISTGGTAVTDSTFTSSSGSYSINITGGVYTVVFSKAGYMDFNYNGGASVVLTNTIALSNSTLTAGSQINVNGNISGNWMNTNTYIVTGNITVPSGQTLTIQQGTNIKFNGYYSITVDGSLIANGTSLSPILFTSNLPIPSPGNWDRINVNGNGSVFNFCIFDYFTRGLNIYYSSPIVTNNEFSNFNGIAIYANGCSSIISKNWIHDYQSDIYAQGITYDGSSNIIVECNKIHDGGGYGIRPFGGGIVRNNIIYNIKSASRGIAFGCGPGTLARIENNFMHDCNLGFWINGSITPIPHPYIINNTISNMLYAGIEMNDNYSNADIINNIFTDCNIGIYQSVPSCTPMCSTTPSVVANNLMYNNTGGNYVGVQIVGIGSIVSTNGQGNPVDPYFNMSQDPLFSGNVPPSLNPTSPCINAGKVGYSANIGFDTSFVCNTPVMSVHENTKNIISVKLFPNPSSGTFYLELDSDIFDGEIVLINTVGAIVYREKIVKGFNMLNPNQIASGLYNYLLLSNKQKVYNGKLIIE
jgi:hypothetical protein